MEYETLTTLTKTIRSAEEKLNICGDKYIVVCQDVPVRFAISMIGLSNPKHSNASDATPMNISMATLHGKTVYMGFDTHGMPVLWRDALKKQIAMAKDLIQICNDVGIGCQ